MLSKGNVKSSKNGKLSTGKCYKRNIFRARDYLLPLNNSLSNKRKYFMSKCFQIKEAEDRNDLSCLEF